MELSGFCMNFNITTQKYKIINFDALTLTETLFWFELAFYVVDSVNHRVIHFRTLAPVSEPMLNLPLSWCVCVACSMLQLSINSERWNLLLGEYTSTFISFKCLFESKTRKPAINNLKTKIHTHLFWIKLIKIHTIIERFIFGTLKCRVLDRCDYFLAVRW